MNTMRVALNRPSAAWRMSGGSPARGRPVAVALAIAQHGRPFPWMPAMSLSMHESSVPVMAHALESLSAVLGKGHAHALAQGYAPEVLLQMRLYPDMFPLVRQVQIATDAAKNLCARLAGQTPPAIADTEATFEELQARIATVVAYIRGLDPADFQDSQDRAITVPSRHGERHFTGRTYLQGFAMPNLYFHCATAYDILRHAGVPLGKADFLGG